MYVCYIHPLTRHGTALYITNHELLKKYVIEIHNSFRIAILWCRYNEKYLILTLSVLKLWFVYQTRFINYAMHICFVLSGTIIYFYNVFFQPFNLTPSHITTCTLFFIPEHTLHFSKFTHFFTFTTCPIFFSTTTFTPFFTSPLKYIFISRTYIYGMSQLFLPLHHTSFFLSHKCTPVL